MTAYIVSAEEMKNADRNTSARFGISPDVLMERAALEVVRVIREDCARRKKEGAETPRVLVFAGGGGNGGDGIAVSRILHEQGTAVLLVTVGEIAKFGDAAKHQLETAMRYGVPMIRLSEPEEAEAVRMVTERRFDYLVDALFGIGLSRPLTGVFSAAVALIRQLKETEGDALRICSIDMPSGIHTDTGEVCGIAVQADVTVTMNHRKRGLVLYPGTVYAGEIVVADAGITKESFADEAPALLSLTGSAAELLPGRDPSANKGGFGKLLIIAGCGQIGGAAILAARAAFAAGVGMVRVFTEKNNRTALLQTVPEALIDVWDEEAPVDRMEETLRNALSWANACVIGPGIGTGEAAAQMMRIVLRDNRLPLVIDADGCNLIAGNRAIRDAVGCYRPEEAWPVLTPHVGEFARLTGKDAAVVKQEFLTLPKTLADELACTVLCKDARSIAAGADCAQQILNLAGNCGMATAGSGDVLAGIVGALAAQGLPPMEAAARGSRLHGLAGDAAAAGCGQASMTAGDIIHFLTEITR
ncbi:MAG: NAD(P)H-hydrate dehydratase [Lachnospiraceae bacterium]|nr:NAD(P)H-hydrate dehydratase [Lachnospiraceae bacterium]